jgi:hypothetical protein
MNWWIFIHFYLCQNSLRRWWEQPLSLLSKLVVAGLLGILGAGVTLGIKELGRQLDARLTDRNALTCLITETVAKNDAINRLQANSSETHFWDSIGGATTTFFQAPASVDLDNGQKIPVIAAENLEQFGLVDDFYVLSTSLPENGQSEFELEDFRSVAMAKPPSEEVSMILNGRDALLANLDRLALAYTHGFTQTTILRADSLQAVRKANATVTALANVESRQIYIQSNLTILEELQTIRAIQAQALIFVTIASSTILGLVFGSLAWMEFREERYLLALIRSFGVGRITLLIHAMLENCLLAVCGVVLGFVVLRFSGSFLNLDAINLHWLRDTQSLFGEDGIWLLGGAMLGGLLSCIPIMLGLRKPLGLVLS